MTSSANSISVIGAGSWGTALAIQLARAGQKVFLWGRETDLMEEMAESRVNSMYLPDATLPDGVVVCADVEKAVAGQQDLLISVPSHVFRVTLESLQPLMSDRARIAWATKGFEVDTGKLPHQVAHEVLGDSRSLAVLSGPTFAKEVGAGLPTAMTIAATDADFATDLAARISDQHFRAYVSEDITGVEIGGAVKNVLAIATGISDGLGYGANTRVALITRGLAELMRLGLALGAQKDTFMGLSGMGDLVLTCTDNQSRNRRMGLALAAGTSQDDAARDIQQVVEGVTAAKAVHQVAARLGVEMPICEQVYRIVHEGQPVEEAGRELMSRAPSRE